MTEVLLMRHAQASFGADDYDVLSAAGHAQAHATGRWLAATRRAPDRIVTGAMRRHAQTCDGLRAALPSLPAPRTDARLNEYDPARIAQAWLGLLRARGAPLPQMSPQAARRDGFQVLRDALAAWARGDIVVAGHDGFERFADAVLDAVLDACRPDADGDAAPARVLVITSAGPIAAVVQRLVHGSPESFAALNVRIRNASLGECVLRDARLELLSFNGVEHLRADAAHAAITQA